MGLGITLQDERGVEVDHVEDFKNYLGSLLPDPGDHAFPMLASIDFYGDTIFNRMQMDRFLSEWKQVSSKAHSPEERQLFSTVEKLALRVRDEVHLYLRFIGD